MRLSNEAAGRSADLERPELAILRKAEDDRRQPKTRGPNLIRIGGEVGRDRCPYFVEHLSQHLQRLGREGCIAHEAAGSRRVTRATH